MEKQFVTFEIAKKLKEIGFKEPCLAYYPLYDFEDDNKNLYKKGQLIFICQGYTSYGRSYDEIKPNIITNDEVNKASAPMWQQVFEWFRKARVHMNIEFNNSTKLYYQKFNATKTHPECFERKTYKSYYDAQEKTILNFINLI